MKTSLLLAAVFAAVLSVPAEENGLERYTADYYKLHAGEYIGEKVKVYAHTVSICDPFEYYHPDYVMVEVGTSYGETKCGSILVSVPADKISTFKKQYTKPGDCTEIFEQAEELSGILRAGKSKQGRRFLYIAFGDRNADEQNHKQLRRYIGQKITIEAHSAVPDISETINYPVDSSTYIVQTSKPEMASGRIAVVIPKSNLPYFKKTFLDKVKSPQKLSGYLYEHEAAAGSFFFLYCDTTPLGAENNGSATIR